jgi:hypothetical protein
MRDTVLRHHAGKINISNAVVTQQLLKTGFEEAVCLFLNDNRRISPVPATTSG